MIQNQVINHKAIWKELIALEPRLENLRQRAVTDRANNLSSGQINHIWYEEYKAVMKELIGFGADKKILMLKSTESYDVAYHVLYYTLTGNRVD